MTVRVLDGVVIFGHELVYEQAVCRSAAAAEVRHVRRGGTITEEDPVVVSVRLPAVRYITILLAETNAVNQSSSVLIIEADVIAISAELEVRVGRPLLLVIIRPEEHICTAFNNQALAGSYRLVEKLVP